jgi:hypothetical protein
LRGNAGSTICFLASPKDAELLVEYSGEYIAQTYSNLSNGNVVATCLRDGEPQTPVTANTFMYPGYSKRRAELIKNVSSFKYGRTREKVEKAISRELGIAQMQIAVSKEKKRYDKINTQQKNIRDMVSKLASQKRMPSS